MKQSSTIISNKNSTGFKSKKPDVAGTGLNNNSSKAYNNFGKPPEKSQDFSTFDILSCYHGIKTKPIAQKTWRNAIDEIKRGKYSNQVDRARKLLEG